MEYQPITQNGRYELFRPYRATYALRREDKPLYSVINEQASRYTSGDDSAYGCSCTL